MFVTNRPFFGHGEADLILTVISLLLLQIFTTKFFLPLPQLGVVIGSPISILSLPS